MTTTSPSDAEPPRLESRRSGVDSMRTSGDDRSRILIATLLLTFLGFRVVLHLRPDTDLFVAGHDVHHLYTGVLLMAFFGIPAVIAGRPRSSLNVAGFGAGTAMALDQWIYLITTDGTNASYVTSWSLCTGTVMVLLAVGYALIVGRAVRKPLKS
jgi:hypothetical protein